MMASSAEVLPPPPPEPPDWDYCIVTVMCAADKCNCLLDSCDTTITKEDEHAEVFRSLCNSVIETFGFSFLLLKGSLTISDTTLQCEKVLVHMIMTHGSDLKWRPGLFHGDFNVDAISLPIVILSFVHFNTMVWDKMGQFASNKPRAMDIVDFFGLLFWNPTTVMVFHDPRLISGVLIALVTTLTSLYIFEIVPTDIRDQLQNITHLVYNVGLWDSRFFLERISSFSFVGRMTIKDVVAWASLIDSCERIGTEKLALSLLIDRLYLLSQIEPFVMSFVMKGSSNLAPSHIGKPAVWFWNATEIINGNTKIGYIVMASHTICYRKHSPLPVCNKVAGNNIEAGAQLQGREYCWFESHIPDVGYFIGSAFNPYVVAFGLTELTEVGDYSCSATLIMGSFGYLVGINGYLLQIHATSVTVLLTLWIGMQHMLKSIHKTSVQALQFLKTSITLHKKFLEAQKWKGIPIIDMEIYLDTLEASRGSSTIYQRGKETSILMDFTLLFGFISTRGSLHFKQWDPGGSYRILWDGPFVLKANWKIAIIIQRCYFSFNLEDKVDFKGEGNVMNLSFKRSPNKSKLAQGPHNKEEYWVYRI